ncbi:MAG: hypothetical protein QOE70_1326 [Chthoniobacter sp.]|nr:hypothetical protein [Chthoniobacter sp.]
MRLNAARRKSNAEHRTKVGATSANHSTFSVRRSTFGVCFLLAALPLAAAEPTLTHLYPVAGQQGTTVSVTVAGKFEPWPPQVWVDAPGITFTTGKTTGKFDVEIAKDAPPGPHLVRFFNENGASAPRFFIVSAEPELLEVEPNNDFKSPQKIASLPATIGGRLDKAGDVDSFAITLQRGERLTVWVEAYVLGSTFDGMLRIVDPHGTQLAFNHDGRTLDPFLTWQAPGDGTFIVQLMGFAYPATAAVGLTGGEGCIYRLHFRTGPLPRDAGEAAEFAGPEPGAQPLAVPGATAGCIQKAGEEDRFAFSAVKQRAYEFKLTTARTGSPLDAWMKIENQDGKELARNDDAAASRDPQLTWTALTDGTFSVVIGDLTHHGGADFTYRLALAEAAPAVTATAASHFVTVAPGKTAEMKVTVKRVNGFKEKLQLAAKNLPEGVTAPEVEIPEKAGDATLKFLADAKAKPAGQPMQLILREPDSGTEHPVEYPMIATSENNGVPAGYTELVINSTDQLWLTVPAAPPK